MEVIFKSLSSLMIWPMFFADILVGRDSSDMPTFAGRFFFPEHLGEP